MERDKEYFAKKFKDLESAPPLGVWNDLENKLDKRNSKKRGIIFFRIAAGLALLITFSWFGWNSISTKENNLTEKKSNTRSEITAANTSNEMAILNDSLACLDEEINKVDQKQLAVIEPKRVQNINSNQSTSKKVAKKSNEITTAKDTVVKDSKTIEEMQNEINIAFYQERNTNFSSDSINTEQLALHQKDPSGDDISASRSITIVLKPLTEQEFVAENADEEKGRLRKFKDILNQDFYKYKIRLGETPDLALNKFILKSN